MIINYKIIIDKNIPFNINTFRNFIKKVIHDKKGIRVLFSDKLILKETKDPNEQTQMTINLVSNDDVERICGFDLLSCADRTNGNVYLNWTRWDEGSHVFFGGLKGKYAKLSKKEKINLYRTYIVNHEILHILGFDHPPPNVSFKGKRTSVMAQQTVDLRGGATWWWPEKSDKAYFRRYSYSQFDL